MSTGSDVAEVLGAATELVGLGVEVFKAAKAQADAGEDEAAAAAAREQRKHALMQVARETQRQLLEFELEHDTEPPR